MGKKRKHADSDEDYIRRKIRRLEEKLINKAKRNRVIYSSDDDLSSQSSDSPPPMEAECESPLPVIVHAPASPPSQPESPPPPDSPPPPPPSPLLPPPKPPLPPPTASIIADHNATAETIVAEELEGDILQLLGDAPRCETALGPPIHKDVASRWQEILVKGLLKDTKEKLLEEYLVPSNCNLLIAPNLNPEAKAALSDPLVKRDTFLMQKQKQIGIALSALASATSLILSNETSKQKLLKPISDACRILCDNHFMETKSRRNMVISSTNMQLKDTLMESVRDQSWLFGENISEKVKAAKSIQRSGDDLKNQPKQTPKNSRGRLNFKPQHRKVDHKPASSSDSGRGRPHQAAARGSARGAHHRPGQRSPPPRRSYHK
ncbi:H/ACA ribonucleoprotein complex non-core subunit NAF1-like [Pectinophora gossypiella]|uniref:H/ACA ribonucleoprotein complex non-core subunit NAF1-like n=1 Tax=Pectinophora gossypiella TaxID=13191 RepID=UPI00214EA39B|nr:H/ACA ribonucleoprotein complex non-core subunit NAF1-like [Pectinophora gossypiella]XP_049865491.1 H/ACA ribonucleoprotein complex non-core subunit NAF1-like [Pectinophora gossypiella]